MLLSVVAGAVFAGAGLVAAPLVGLAISNDLGNDGGHVTWLTLGIGTFVIGTILSWLLMLRGGRMMIARGAATGILVALFSYPVVVILAEFVQRDAQALPPLR